MNRTPLPQWPGSIPRQRFDTLLWTWHVQIHRRRTPIQLRDWITPDGQLDEQALEKEYGIGKVRDRKASLDGALIALRNKPAQVDFDQIWWILNDAKTALVLWYVENNEPDDCRVVYTEKYVVLSNLYNWARRAQRLFRLKYSVGSIQEMARTLRPRTLQERQLATQLEALKLADGENPEIVQLLDDLVIHLSDDPLLQVLREQSPPHRRSRIGAPSPKKNILTPATRLLAKAGVTGWIRADLLDATGLNTLALNRK